MDIKIKSEEFNFFGFGHVKDSKLVSFFDSDNDISFPADMVHPYSAGLMVGKGVERFGAEGSHMIPAEWVVIELPVEGHVHYDSDYGEWEVDNVKINGQPGDYFGEGNLDAAIDALCEKYKELMA